MKNFDYVRPATLSDAVAAAAEPGAVYLAAGQGAALDEPGAFQWFKHAAELGVADSQYNLGILYLQGRGVTADAAQAYFWFTIAANGGDPSANARAAMLEPAAATFVAPVSEGSACATA